MTTNKLSELQALRAIAAGLVVIDHSIGRLWGRTNEAASFFADHLGDMGVCIFFVISGFIMVRTSRRDFGEPGAGGRFFLRRVERVVPLYWIALVIAAAFAFGRLGAAGTVSGILKSALFIPYANGTGMMRPIHGVGWTLNYEMFFYAIFALCLLLPKRSVVPAAVGALVAVVVAGLLVAGPAWGAEPTNAITFLTYPIILLFAAGMLLALAPRQLGNIPATAFAFFPLVVVSCVLFLGLVHTYPVAIGWRFVVYALATLYVAAVVLLHDQREHRGPVSRFMERLGDQSYSTYLFHTLAFDVLVFKLHLAERVGNVAAFVILLIVAHVVGYASFRFLEEPMMNFFKRVSHRPKPKSLPV